MRASQSRGVVFTDTSECATLSVNQQAVLSLIAQYEDISALLCEGNDSMSTGLVSEDVFSRPTVDGILSALEDRCIITNSPVSVISAAVLGDKLRSASLVLDESQLLTDAVRDQLITSIEVCKRLLNGPGFSQKAFIKSLCREEMPNLEVIWRFHAEGLIQVESFIASNISRPLAIKGLAQSITSLCCRGTATEKTQPLRQQIVSGLVIGLLRLDNASSDPDFSDSTARGLKKVSSALLDSITKKILLMGGELLDVSPFSDLSAVDLSTRVHYCTRQLNVVLSTNAVYTVSDALMEQSKWTSQKISQYFKTLFQQLLDVLKAPEVIGHLRRALDFQEVNWKSVLSLTSITLVSFPDAANLFEGFIQDLLRRSLDEGDSEGLVAGMLLARQSCLEGQHVFMSYADWFQKSFSTEKTSLCGNKKSFAILAKFFTDIVPYETASFLRVHILRGPFLPAKCRPLWADYVLLAKTRLIDLKESLDDELMNCSLTNSDKSHQLGQIIEADIEKALGSFEKTGKIPTSVMEASIFRKPYFVGRFIPALLQPRPLPDIPDLRMRFISALLKAGKVQESMVNSYEAECKKLAAQLLEGVHFDDDDDDDFEMLLSTEEQLEKSMERLRDSVLEAHHAEVLVLEGERPFIRQLTAVSEKLNAHFNTNNPVIPDGLDLNKVDVTSPLTDNAYLKIAQKLLNSICQVVTGLHDIDCVTYDPSWLTGLLLVIRSHSELYSVMCRLLCHLVSRRSDSLLACHLHGLAAIAFHWTNITECQSRVVVSTAPSEDNLPVHIGAHLLDSLPMSTAEEISSTLQFVVSFAKYAMKRKRQMLEKRRELEESAMDTSTNVSLVSDKSLSLESDHNTGFNELIPDRLVHIISYLGPKKFTELRTLFPVAFKALEQQSVACFLSADTMWSLARQKRMVFEEWVRSELDAAYDGDQTEYYDWVVLSGWHVPTADKSSPTRLRSYCVSLARGIMEYDCRFRCREQTICHRCQSESTRSSERKPGNLSALTQLLQRLSYLSHREEATTRAVHWMWSLSEHQASTQTIPDSDLAISSQAETEAFCGLLQCTPPHLLLASNLENTKVLGLDNLRSTINNRVRNHLVRGIALPVGLLIHIILMLESVPQCSVMSFVEDCPLIFTSLLVHWSTMAGIIKTMSTSMLGVYRVASAAYQRQATTTCVPSSTWLAGVAAYSHILHDREPIEGILKVLDSKSASSLLHCLTLDMADTILHREPVRDDLIQASLSVWTRFGDSLRTLDDDPDKVGSGGISLALCTADSVMRLQPAACLRLVMKSVMSKSVHQPGLDWDPSAALLWYSACAKQFDSAKCEDSSLILLLEEASKAMETLICSFSRVQLISISRELIDSLDERLRFVLEWQLGTL